MPGKGGYAHHVARSPLVPHPVDDAVPVPLNDVDDGVDQVPVAESLPALPGVLAGTRVVDPEADRANVKAELWVHQEHDAPAFPGFPSGVGRLPAHVDG